MILIISIQLPHSWCRRTSKHRHQELRPVRHLRETDPSVTLPKHGAPHWRKSSQLCLPYRLLTKFYLATLSDKMGGVERQWWWLWWCSVVVVVVMFFAVQKGPRLQPQVKGSNSLCAKSKTTVYGSGEIRRSSSCPRALGWLALTQYNRAY